MCKATATSRKFLDVVVALQNNDAVSRVGCIRILVNNDDSIKKHKTRRTRWSAYLRHSVLTLTVTFQYLITYSVVRSLPILQVSWKSTCSKYVGPHYCRVEMYAGRVACWPLVSHGEFADGTDRWTDWRAPDRYITLSSRWGQRNNFLSYAVHRETNKQTNITPWKYAAEVTKILHVHNDFDIKPTGAMASGINFYS